MIKITSLNFRRPTISDANKIWKLVKESPPLDVNSQYLYLLLCYHFHNTCIVAESNGKIVGFVSGYIPPKQANTLFVWQVAVKESSRGSGIAAKMIQKLVERLGEKISFVEATVTPSNKASESLFESIKSSFNTEITRDVMFSKEHFGKDAHEEEHLFRIGPIKSKIPMEAKLH